MTIKFSDITGGGIPYGNTSGRPVNAGVGKLYSNGELQRLEIYTGTQYGWQNIVAETPGVTGYTGTVHENNGGTITIIGTNFATGANATAVGTDGTEYIATTTTVNNLTNITAVFPPLPGNKEPYDIRVTNPSNLYGVYYDILTINDSPIWQTASGSLATIDELTNLSASVLANDEENNTISYSSSNLPSWINLNSSTGALTGTAPEIASNTTYNFTITASDGNNNNSRSFSVTVTNIASISAELVMVGGGGGTGYDVGGGGGAGGMIDTTINLTRGSTYTISSIGSGGGSSQGSPTQWGLDGTDTVAFGLTAIGGGGGGYYASSKNGRNGGSGGGAGMDSYGGTALQPSSGSGGYGHAGGGAGGAYGSGGGGGAGGAGATGVSNVQVAGGLPRYSSITGSSVGYSGGGFGNTDGGALAPTGQNLAGTSLGYYGFGANGTGQPNASPYNGNPGVVIIAYPNIRPALTIPETLTYDQPTRSGYRVYRFTAGSGTITVN